MSVLSDNWIVGSCLLPTHDLYLNGTKIRTIYPPYTEEEVEWINNKEQTGVYALPTTSINSSFIPVIEGFVPSPVRYVSKLTGEPVDPANTSEPYRKVISFGTSSYGYDVRLQADQKEIKVFTNVHCSEIDPKNIKEENFASPEIRVDSEGAKYVLIPPHSYIQAPTIEYFRIPRNVLVIVVGKSTYARSALITNVTPIEPEFEGNVVIEVANVSSSPVRCYLEEGIAQFVFLRGELPCSVSYKDKNGKYQGQTGLTFAKV